MGCQARAAPVHADGGVSDPCGGAGSEEGEGEEGGLGRARGDYGLGMRACTVEGLHVCEQLTQLNFGLRIALLICARAS